MAIKRCLEIVVAVLLTAATLAFVRDWFRMRALVKELEDKRRNDVIERYAPRFVAIPAEVREQLRIAYEGFAYCYRRGNKRRVVLACKYS